ncbi:unnamed protein product [Sphagnum compactum]
MFAKLALTEEEKTVDEQLGYPHGYAKLCRCHASTAELQHGLQLTPFTEGPPQRFLPYSPQAEDFVKLKEWDSLFPVIVEEADTRDPPNARKHAEELWQQLDHLGNAGFDPAKFRVDAYGNVVYWNADPSSPLAWEVDHWYPHSRGGKTLVSNLRVMQWQAHQRKKNRLEFLVPWWDLQHGVSINQFLSAFASKNSDFRRRSFALFFAGGEDEKVAREHVGECRPWPQQFREKKVLCGLAAAAIVSPLREDNEDMLNIAQSTRAVFASSATVTPTASGTAVRRRWSAEEEESLKRSLQRFGPGCWKEIKENEPALANRSTAQIKDKFRLMRGEWKSGKENIAISTSCNGRSEYLDEQSAATINLQKELRVKIMREEEKREKEEDISQLEETVATLRQQNEKERLALLELEDVLRNQKQEVEKHRRWAETQSSYRLCLERMIRDIMHQSMAYKEQARLNQAACNALMARLDCQKVTCDAVEKDLLQCHSHREALAATLSSDMRQIEERPCLRGQNIVDVSSCVSLFVTNEDHEGGSGQRGSVNEAKSASDATLYHDAKAQDKEEEWVQLLKVEERAREDEANAELDNENGCKGMEGESDFADDEMSCDLHGVQDALVTEQVIKIEMDGGDQKGEGSSGGTEDDTSIIPDGYSGHPLASEALIEELLVDKSRPDCKQEDQKNVIIEQSQRNAVAREVRIHCGAQQTYKHTAELLQQVRLQMQMTEVSEGRVDDCQPSCEQEENFDELLQQVLTTHVNRVQRNEAGAEQGSDSQDEEQWQIGKSNLDKWLQVLLQKDGDSTGSSPAHDSTLHNVFSPALSTARAATTGSVDLEDSLKKAGENTGKPKGLWGGLLRKLSVKQQTELSRHLREETGEEPRGLQTQNKDEDLTYVLNSLKNIMLNEDNEAKSKPFEFSHEAIGVQGGEADHMPRDATELIPVAEAPAFDAEEGVTACDLDTHLIFTHKISATETDTESLSSTNNPDSQSLEGKDMSKTGFRASFKAATHVWRKAVKKLEMKLQEGLTAPPPLD